PWRDALRAACLAALPALTDGAPASAAPRAPLLRAEPSVGAAQRLQVTAPELSILTGVDRVGARLLLFPPDGGLLLFTGERTGVDAPDAVGPLVLRRTAAGVTELRFRGPMLRFPDTTPFLDLEAGLARARLVTGDVALDIAADHAGAGADFGHARGRVVLDDGPPLALSADAFVGEDEAGGPWPRLRAALR